MVPEMEPSLVLCKARTFLLCSVLGLLLTMSEERKVATNFSLQYVACRQLWSQGWRQMGGGRQTSGSRLQREGVWSSREFIPSPICVTIIACSLIYTQDNLETHLHPILDSEGPCLVFDIVEIGGCFLSQKFEDMVTLR